MEKLRELLAALEANPDLFESYTADEVAEAKVLLAEFAASVKAGEIEADRDAIEEAKVLGVKLGERETAIAEETEAQAAALAELEAALGITDEEVEEIIEEVEATTEGPEDEDDDEDEAEDKAPEVVMASAKPTIGALSKAMPKDRKPAESSPYTLVASAGQREGEVLTASAFGDMALHRWQRMGNERVTLAEMTGLKHKYEVRKGDDEHNERVFAAIAAEASASASLDAVLTASGGFCAPAEVLYGFFNIATRAGILALPTVNAPRGAISLPVSPSLGDFLGQSGIATEWTNANDENPTSPATKPVYVFECPEFQECEVAAWPTILQFGNFVGRFYPEAVANAQGLALIAADRTVNAARLAFMVAAATAGNVQSTGAGGLVDLTTNLASNAADYRQTYGMGRDAVLDVVLPHWVEQALYADSIARDSTTGVSNVGWLGRIFAELNLRPQFVYDLDDQTNGLFEAEANVLMYAPGTVVELDGGTLDLGVVRDSTLNATNDYQVFTEPFTGWCVPGHEIRSLTIPVCATGGTGDRVSIACPPAS